MTEQGPWLNSKITDMKTWTWNKIQKPTLHIPSLNAPLGAALKKKNKSRRVVERRWNRGRNGGPNQWRGTGSGSWHGAWNTGPSHGMDHWTVVDLDPWASAGLNHWAEVSLIMGKLWQTRITGGPGPWGNVRQWNTGGLGPGSSGRQWNNGWPGEQ